MAGTRQDPHMGNVGWRDKVSIWKQKLDWSHTDVTDEELMELSKALIAGAPECVP